MVLLRVGRKKVQAESIWVGDDKDPGSVLVSCALGNDTVEFKVNKLSNTVFFDIKCNSILEVMVENNVSVWGNVTHAVCRQSLLVKGGIIHPTCPYGSITEGRVTLRSLNQDREASRRNTLSKRADGISAYNRALIFHIDGDAMMHLYLRMAKANVKIVGNIGELSCDTATISGLVRTGEATRGIVTETLAMTNHSFV